MVADPNKIMLDLNNKKGKDQEKGITKEIIKTNTFSRGDTKLCSLTVGDSRFLLLLATKLLDCFYV